MTADKPYHDSLVGNQSAKVSIDCVRTMLPRQSHGQSEHKNKIPTANDNTLLQQHLLADDYSKVKIRVFLINYYNPYSSKFEITIKSIIAYLNVRLKQFIH